MRWGRALAAAGGAVWVLSTVGCNPAAETYREGRKAELRKDYDTAIIDYEKALQQSPENPRYIISIKLARTKSGTFHLNRGLELLAEGRTDEAVGELQTAARIDPSNERAKQELTRVLAQQAAAKASREKALQQALKPPEQPAAPTGVQLKPLPTEPITHFHLTADSKRVFEALGKFADLNVVFNFDFQPKPMSLDLTNVKLEDMLQAAAYEAHVFWKPISSNTILIIPDSPTNRREYEQDEVQTFHLSNPLAPADRTQISTALRQVLGLQHIIDNPSSNSIIVRDTPDRVAAAGQIIKSLDLGKAEILIDVTILEADRNRMTTLGVIPVTNLNIVPNPNTITITGPNGSTTTTTPGFTPLGGTHLPFLNPADFALALPSATATALLSDATTKVLENPQVRATDGATAKLKIGSKIPYATGSFLPSFTGSTGTTTGGVGLLASTQFQYQDIGVNLEITPHLTAVGEIALHAKVEILTQAGTESLGGGLSQPIFGQRSIEHDIELQEGEVSLLGGLIDRETTNTVGGLPGLGDIPVVKYLFSETTRNVTDNEILIMLNPHVIRLPEVAPQTAATVSGGAGPAVGPNLGVP
ncbi:MAG TPA: secretin N-terminal domain-containing protein [Terriglobia bacterium]